MGGGGLPVAPKGGVEVTQHSDNLYFTVRLDTFLCHLFNLFICCYYQLLHQEFFCLCTCCPGLYCIRTKGWPYGYTVPPPSTPVPQNVYPGDPKYRVFPSPALPKIS